MALGLEKFYVFGTEFIGIHGAIILGERGALVKVPRSYAHDRTPMTGNLEKFGVILYICLEGKLP
ncbi:hypothetical protein AGMMS49546_27920 [Spirochaetia bacterium]|nr:hypothetical protein AGMMS49546_27920 [Spirochaetia bacterium]